MELLEGQALDGQPAERRQASLRREREPGALRIAQREEQRHVLVRQPACGGDQHSGRGSVEPLQIVDGNKHGPFDGERTHDTEKPSATPR